MTMIIFFPNRLICWPTSLIHRVFWQTSRRLSSPLALRRYNSVFLIYITKRECGGRVTDFLYLFSLGFGFVSKDSRSSDIPDRTKNALAGKIALFIFPLEYRNKSKIINVKSERAEGDFRTEMKVWWRLTRLSRITFGVLLLLLCLLCKDRSMRKTWCGQILMFYSKVVIIIFIFLTGLVILLNV